LDCSVTILYRFFWEKELLSFKIPKNVS